MNLIPAFLRKPAASPAASSEAEQRSIPAPLSGPEFIGIRRFYGSERYLRGVNTTKAVVTPETAMTCAAVWACVNTISKDLSALPLRLIQKLPSGEVRQAVEHPAYQLTSRSPDGGTSTPMRFRQAMMAHMLLWGNSYIEVIRLGGGGVQLGLLDPRQVEPIRLSDWSVEYMIGGQQVPSSKIIHVAGLGMDGICGFSAVLLAQQAIALALTGERFAGSFISNGQQASGLLKSEANMTPEAQQELLDSFVAMTSDSGPGGVGILPAGVSFDKLSIDPQNAQLLESRQWQVLEICRLFNVPPHKCMVFDKASYSTIEASTLEYVGGCLGPLSEMVEQSWNIRLLTADEQAAGYTFQHDFKSLMRGDSTARANYWKALVGMGAVNANTVAMEEGFAPHEGGEKYLVPLNMTDSANSQPANDGAAK